MSGPSHLTETATRALELAAPERIARIRSPMWIGYPRAKRILAKLEDLMIYPKSHRMPNLLLVGETNNGKTMLAQHFLSMHPPRDRPDNEGVDLPVLLVQAPPIPDEGRFYNAILHLLFAAYRPNDRVDKKQFQIIKILRHADLKILMIDEIHHILAGNMNRQRAFLNTIKYLGNELQVPIVGIGTKDALRAVQTDPQLANRFEPAALPRWSNDEDFLRLLVSFERTIPLRNPSLLHETPLAQKLFTLSEGYIGELSRLIAEAAVRAVETGTERIDLKTLNSINWIPPSDRRREAERL